VQARGVCRKWECGSPIFPYKSRENGNGQSVDWKREWESKIHTGKPERKLGGHIKHNNKITIVHCMLHHNIADK